MSKGALAAGLSSLVLGLAGAAGDSPALPRAELHTTSGVLIVELELEKAPVSVANFLRYVDEGRFAGATFYRVVRDDNQAESAIKIDVIQGGLGFAESEQRLPPIAHETTATTGLRHLDGTLSMARNEPGSASSEIFVCVGDQPELDFGGMRNPDGQGFAAFGRVVSGMEVVRDIHGRPADGQVLRDPVAVLSVRRSN